MRTYLDIKPPPTLHGMYRDENQGNSGRVRMVRGMDEHSGTTALQLSQIDRLRQTVMLSVEPLRAGGLRAHSFRKTDSRICSEQTLAPKSRADSRVRRRSAPSSRHPTGGGFHLRDLMPNLGLREHTRPLRLAIAEGWEPLEAHLLSAIGTVFQP